MFASITIQTVNQWTVNSVSRDPTWSISAVFQGLRQSSKKNQLYTFILYDKSVQTTYSQEIAPVCVPFDVGIKSLIVNSFLVYWTVAVDKQEKWTTCQFEDRLAGLGFQYLACIHVDNYHSTPWTIVILVFVNRCIWHRVCVVLQYAKHTWTWMWRGCILINLQVSYCHV